MTEGHRANRAPIDGESPNEASPPYPFASEQQCLANEWTVALSELLRLGLAGKSDVLFHYGNAPDTIPTALERAAELGADGVCLYFGGPETGGPTNVVALVHGKRGLATFEHCDVWAFKPWLPAELIATKRRFKLVDGARLKGRSNNLDALRARRVARTRELWRGRAFEIAGQFVPSRPA